MRLLQLLVITLLLVHLYACILAISTTLADSPLDTWLATHGLCWPLDGVDDATADFFTFPNASVARASGVTNGCVAPHIQYLYAFYFAMGTIVIKPPRTEPSTFAACVCCALLSRLVARSRVAQSLSVTLTGLTSRSVLKPLGSRAAGLTPASELPTLAEEAAQAPAAAASAPAAELYEA